MAIRAVVFGLDDTLILDEEATRQAFTATAAYAAEIGACQMTYRADSIRLARELWERSSHYSFCVRIGINDAECLWGDFGVQTEELVALGEWAKQYRIEVFDRAFCAQGIEPQDFGQKAAAIFASTRKREAHWMPDAWETLVTLQKDYRLGLLTNGAPDLQRGKLTASGLQAFFDAVVVSGEHPVGKPDPLVFHCVLDQLGVSPHESVMIGNSVVRDIAGANASGMRSILFEVPGAEEPDDALPTASTSRLAAIPGLLAQLALQAN